MAQSDIPINARSDDEIGGDIQIYHVRRVDNLSLCSRMRQGARKTVFNAYRSTERGLISVIQAIMAIT